MKMLLALFAVVATMSCAAHAQSGGGNCSNVNDPMCSKSPSAPVGREAILGSIVLPAEPSVDYSGPLVVGEPLPEVVTVYPVPQYYQYAYAVVGPRRVVIERQTRRIVRLMD
jgi:hypothetical protein